MSFGKFRRFIHDYFPMGTPILFLAALAAGIVHIISEYSAGFSDFVNRYISSAVRGILAVITGVLPFSAAETVVVLIPVLFAAVLVGCFMAANKGNRYGIRFVVGLSSVLSLLYTLFVFSSAVAYNGTPLSLKLGLDLKPAGASELYVAAEYMKDKMDTELENIRFKYSGSSVMPYSLMEMNALLLEAYDEISDKYSFVPRLYSRIKPIALSEPMTYTHISGMYTYYTGEANLNVNFPDYSLPFTAAHELAHQRGIMPENEANFMAFLVCIQSDDPYIRYSGYLNMYEYLSSALYTADYELFAEIYTSLDPGVKGEIKAYNAFFEKYRENTAADVSSALNDTYLKSQEQSAGEKSYGMVVDLAAAYVYSVAED